MIVFGITCIGINSLESLAFNIKKDGLIISLIDCKNDNCYFSIYEKKDNCYTNITLPSTDSIDNILNINHIISTTPTIFVGDGVDIYKEKIKEKFPNSILGNQKENQLDSYSLALAGFTNYINKKDSSDILPLYLKKPQAQIQLEEKEKNNN